MTPSELVTRIEEDIKWKGGASVPVGIFQEAFSIDSRDSATLGTELEEFAGSHGWHFRHDDLITPRIMFFSVNGAGKISEKERK